VSYLAQLVFDDVEVIYQPFRGGRDSPVIAYGVGKNSVYSDKLSAVFLQARNESPPTAWVGRYAVLGG
jgi:hypothetical protein